MRDRKIKVYALGNIVGYNRLDDSRNSYIFQYSYSHITIGCH